MVFCVVSMVVRVRAIGSANAPRQPADTGGAAKLSSRQLAWCAMTIAYVTTCT